LKVMVQGLSPSVGLSVPNRGEKKREKGGKKERKRRETHQQTNKTVKKKRKKESFPLPSPPFFLQRKRNTEDPE